MEGNKQGELEPEEQPVDMMEIPKDPSVFAREQLEDPTNNLKGPAIESNPVRRGGAIEKKLNVLLLH